MKLSNYLSFSKRIVLGDVIVDLVSLGNTPSESYEMMLIAIGLSIAFGTSGKAPERLGEFFYWLFGICLKTGLFVVLAMLTHIVWYAFSKPEAASITLMMV